MFLFIVLAGYALAFEHEEPGRACTTSDADLPDDAAEDNTYDYVFVGAGATSTVTAAKLAEDSDCSLRIAIIEAGRSYTEVPECANDFDCYVKRTENLYHDYPAFHAQQALSTPSTWAFETRDQIYSDITNYADGRAPGPNCPYSSFNTIPNAMYIPPTCECISDVYVATSTPCRAWTDCVAQNPSDPEAVCGVNPCAPRVCARNDTNLYWRASSIGGSNAHHAQATYKMSPFIAQKWVEATGDDRFAWRNWERAFKAMADDWLKLSYGANDLTPILTEHNSSLKALLMEAAMASENLTPLTGANRILNNDEFFDDTNPNQAYFGGFAADAMLGRQVDRETGQRSYPARYLDRVKAKCAAAGTLRIIEKSLVTRVVFNDRGDDVSRHAIGAEYVDGGDNFGLDFNFDRATTDERLVSGTTRVYARRGVILGGGVFNTPQLLALSGIDDETQLADIGVPLRKHLPAVGENLQDDAEHSVHFFMTASGDPLAVNSNAPGFADYDFFLPSLLKAFIGYNPAAVDSQTGALLAPPIASNTVCHPDAPALGGQACPAIPEISTLSAAPIDPDESYIRLLQRSGTSSYGEAPVGHGVVFTYYLDEEQRLSEENPSCLTLCAAGFMQKGWYDSRIAYAGRSGILVFCDVLTSRLESRGTVRMRSSHPSDPMIVDTNTYSAESDLERTGKCVNGIRRIFAKANEVAGTNISKYDKLSFSEPTEALLAPGIDVPTDRVTPELETWMRRTLWHHHPSSTARMGRRDDANSVTDSRGRVWGTSNLYVIDMASAAVHVDMFPSNNAMSLGYLQAEALLANDASAQKRTCSVKDYEGAKPADEFDDETRTTAATVVGAVFAALCIVCCLCVCFMLCCVGGGAYTQMLVAKRADQEFMLAEERADNAALRRRTVCTSYDEFE